MKLTITQVELFRVKVQTKVLIHSFKKKVSISQAYARLLMYRTEKM